MPSPATQPSVEEAVKSIDPNTWDSVKNQFLSSFRIYPGTI